MIEGRRRRLAAVLAVSALAAIAAGKESKSDLQRDLNDDSLVGNWIYDDLDAGFARAAKERKPVCVVFR